jgi:hypothetical protein
MSLVEDGLVERQIREREDPQAPVGRSHYSHTPRPTPHAPESSTLL